jgi:hypothetical protein
MFEFSGLKDLQHSSIDHILSFSSTVAKLAEI